MSELGKFADCLNQILKAIPEQSGRTGSAIKDVEKQHIDNCKKCIDDNPLLVEYFSMSEKAERINSINFVEAGSKNIGSENHKDREIIELDKKLKQLLKNKEKIKAITVLREATGLGLAEAKKQIDELECQMNLKIVDSDSLESPAFEVDNSRKDLNSQIRELLVEKRNLEAIRILQNATGLNTEDAKKVIDNLLMGNETDVEVLVEEVKTKTEIKEIVADTTESEKIVTFDKEKYDSSYTTTEMISMMAKKYDISLIVYLRGGTRGFEKKIDKAKSSFASFTSSENPLLLYDRTIFGSCKEGFVLTNKMFYLNNIETNKVCVPICDISKVYSKMDNWSKYIYISTNKGDFQVDSFLKSTSDDKMRSNVEFWCDVLGYLKTMTGSVDEQNVNPKISKSTDGDVETWQCKCGNTNTTKFCTNCGCKKDDIAFWTCSCGSVNKGNFCPECGSPKR